MRGNRFYTPSLPQYTSQFVEDKTPWGEMLALEDMKINRMDKAEETKAQTDAMMSSLIGGPRTQEIAPQVAMQYKTQLDEWVKNHGNSSYTVPALRELTKIRAAWQNDPDVQLVIQDREAAKEYDFYKRDPSYPQMVDPNIDPETRQVRQLKRGDQFTPYARPADVDTFIDQYYRDIKPRVLSGEQATYIKDEESGEMIPILRNTSRTLLDASDFSKVRPELMEAMLQAFGSYMTEEEMARRVDSYQSKRYIDQQQGSAQIRPGYGAGSGKEKEPENTFVWPGARVDLPGGNEEVRPGGEGPGWAKRAGLWVDDKIMKPNPEYYDAWKNDPGKLIRVNTDPKAGVTFTGAGLAGERASKSMIERRFLEDPSGTLAIFEEYFEKAEAEAPNAIWRGQVRGDKARFERIIENAKKDYKINDKPYHNDVDLDNALNFIQEGWESSTPEARRVFQKFAQGDPDITPSDWLVLKTAGTKARSESAGKTFIPQIQTLTPKMQDDLRNALTGFTDDSNRIIKSDGQMSGVFAGARMFDPDNQGKEIDERERKELLKQDNAFILDGFLPSGSHPFKTFILTANIGGKRMFIEGPKKMISAGREIDLIETTRFTNNAFTFELPDKGGVGELFSVSRVNVDDLSDIEVVDNDNEKDGKRSFSEGIVMRIARSHRGTDLDDLGDSQSSPYGNVRMIVYQKDIRGDIDSPFNQPFSDENSNGYISFNLPTDASGRINDVHARYMANEAYIKMMYLKGRFTKEQASELTVRLRMNYGNL